jgi:hypothetical protein
MSNSFVFLLILVHLAWTHSLSPSIENVLDLKTRINRLVVTNSAPGSQQASLFVASTNHLYKIVDAHDSFKVDVDLITGPKLERQQCAVINPSSLATSPCIKYVCDEDADSSKSSLKQVDNDNRLLLIDAQNQNLIECGSIDYGGCRLRRLDDLSIIGCNYSAPVIPFNSASGVVTTASSQLQYSSSKSNLIHQSSLYLMVSIEYDPVEERYDRLDFPVFSVRHLSATQHTHEKRPALIDNSQQLFQSKYLIESMNYDQNIYTDDFHFKIVHSFSHDGFIYFLYTITNKILPESCNRMDSIDSASNQTSTKVVTRLLRICDTKASSSSENRNLNQETIDQFNSIYNSANSGANLATLTETVLDCDDQVEGKFHLLQSAHFQPQPESSENSTLFLVFNNTKLPTQSSVCKITMKEIDDHFLLMLRKCLEGDNNYGELVSPYSNKNSWKTPCRCSTMSDTSKKPAFLSVNDHRKLFCHNDMFNYMNSRQTLTLKSIELDTFEPMRPVTAITSLRVASTDSTHNELVLVLSEVNAQLLMLSYNREKNLARQYDQVSLLSSAPNGFVAQSQHGGFIARAGNHSLDGIQYTMQAASEITLQILNSNDLTNQKYLYATYDRYLYKINLKNCGQFETCTTCLNGSPLKASKQKNPFCGWCIYDQKCTMSHECNAQDARIPKEMLFLTRAIKYDKTVEKSKDVDNICPRILDIQPTRYLNPLSSNNQAIESKSVYYAFKTNMNLLPSPYVYFCDFSLGSNMTRVVATMYNETLRCDLTSNRNTIEAAFRQNPIERKLINVSVQIRAGQSHTALTTSLIANTHLYAFNCSYFADCGQCLSRHLSGSCVWCARNSRCAFAAASRDAKQRECPNELDFYSRDLSDSNKDLCTSFSIKKLSESSMPSENERAESVKVDIPYSAESQLAQLTKLDIKNAKDHQKSFVCLFTKTRQINRFEQTRFTKSDLKW